MLRQDPTNQEVWERFVRRYGPKIYSWTRKWGLQEADGQDAMQNVLVKLAEKMRSFQYDPGLSFRGWLKILTEHACCDLANSRRRSATGSGDSALSALLDRVEARTSLAQQLDETYDQELLEQAMLRVRLRVQPHTWEAFRLTALEGLSGAEAASRLQMKVAHVYMAKSEVQKRLRDEVRKLDPK
jgi:RNA polymerase sigma-70 factor (ECF subfamily)